jgi:MraZ protein
MVSGFLGSHPLTVDEKGRIAIPARYRQSLADQCDSQLVITIGPTRESLEIYPAPEFQRLAGDIQSMEDRKAAEVLKQVFIGFAVEAEIDKQGRLLLPPMLRRTIRLNGSAVLMGQITRFDLLSEECWNRRFGEVDGSAFERTESAYDALKR